MSTTTITATVTATVTTTVTVTAIDQKPGPPFDPLSRLRSKFPRGRSTPSPTWAFHPLCNVGEIARVGCCALLNWMLNWMP